MRLRSLATERHADFVIKIDRNATKDLQQAKMAVATCFRLSTCPRFTSPSFNRKTAMASYDHRSLAFFAADYRPDFGAKTSTCADAIYKFSKPDDASFRPGTNYTFKWHGKRKIYVLTNTRFAIQTLGLDVWRQSADDFLSAVREVEKAFELTELKRIGFKVIASLPQKMTHAELSDLFFGTILSPVDQWESILKTPTDPIVQFTGARNGMKCMAMITAVTTEQAANTISSIQNLEHFGKHKFTDPLVRDFVLTFSNSVALMIDLDLSRESIQVVDIADFFRDSLAAADEIIDAASAKILSNG